MWFDLFLIVVGVSCLIGGIAIAFPLYEKWLQVRR